MITKALITVMVTVICTAAMHCLSTHGAVSPCPEGQFNSDHDEVLCLPCTNCSRTRTFQARNCSDSDTICCPQQSMELLLKSSTDVCEINSTHGLYCCRTITQSSTLFPYVSTSLPMSSLSTQNANTTVDDEVKNRGGTSSHVEILIAAGAILATVVMAVVLIRLRRKILNFYHRLKDQCSHRKDMTTANPVELNIFTNNEN